MRHSTRCIVRLFSTALSDNYKGLLDALMTPELWKEEGNMKGLTVLLQAYIAKDPQFLVANDKIQPILKLHKRLLAKKRSDVQAFHIVQSLVQHVPLYVLRCEESVLFDRGAYSTQFSLCAI